MLETLGALRPPSRLRRRRGRGRALSEPVEPPRAPSTRVTVVRPEPFESRKRAEGWLEGLQREPERCEVELHRALRLLNRALHAQRVAAADPHAADVAIERALAVRIGFGSGDAVADGRYERAWEPPRDAARTRVRSMEAPEERFAALVGGRERALACEELVLRARTDLDAGREREAALTMRVALEALLAELPAQAAALADERAGIGAAANAALDGPLDEGRRATLVRALEQSELALRRWRLSPKRSHSNSQF